MITQLAKGSERMPSIFDDFLTRPWNDWFTSNLPSRAMTSPMVNIAERKDDYLISMAAPGLKKENFKIDVENRILTISSEKEESTEEKEEKFTRKEYSYSSFERSFTLPDQVNKDKIEAQYKEGVLEITLPKKEESKKTEISKKIEVQ